MTEVPTTTNTLENVTGVEQDSYGMAVVVHERDSVILGKTGDGYVEVFRDGEITTYEPGTAIMPLPDPVRETVVLQSALCAIAERNAATLADIRSYAIEKRLDGVICEDGLNEFLRAFGLEEYGS